MTTKPPTRASAIATKMHPVTAHVGHDPYIATENRMSALAKLKNATVALSQGIQGILIGAKNKADATDALDNLAIDTMSTYSPPRCPSI
jgi:hypothetical protein